MWDYGSLDKNQERNYIYAKMKMLNRQMPNAEVGRGVRVCEGCMRCADIPFSMHYLLPPLDAGGKSDGPDIDQPELDARLCL